MWKSLGPPQRKKDTMEIEGVKLKQNRKVDNQREVEDNGITLWEKMQRLEVETKALGKLMTQHLGLVVATKQHHQI